MKKISKYLLIMPFLLLLFACGNKGNNTLTNRKTKSSQITSKDNSTTENNKTSSLPSKYTITLDNQAEGVNIFGITSGSEYECESRVTLRATNIPSGLTIKWSRSDGKIKNGDTYTFIVPTYSITITVTTTKPYTKEGNKLFFGTYPQTEVKDNALINELNDFVGTLPTSENKYSWSDYNYYYDGSISSFMFYKDIDYDNDGSYDYRGVYFTQYRPGYSSEGSPISPYQNRNGYKTNTIYWFSYDPIEWDILEEKSGKALIIANLILDSQEYCPADEFKNETFEHNGKNGYANNYELSNIRKWLNYNFYNTAFNELQKTLIDITMVNNNSYSTGEDSNSYACSNTSDKMFLLSYREAKNYYISESDRQAKGTDYAKSQGLIDIDGYWWLRSPISTFPYTAYYVSGEGKLNGNSVSLTIYGVRPALWILL